MFRPLASLGLLAAAPAALAAEGFDEYLERFGKAYGSEEYQWRKTLFEQRLAEVEIHNLRTDVSWRAGINAMTDMLPAELAKRRGYNKAMSVSGGMPSIAMLQPMAGVGDEGFREHAHTTLSPVAPAPAPAPVPLPNSVDWRDYMYPVMTTVKEQGGCGSCWAFAAAETMESHLAIATGVLMNLSPQPMTSCTPNPRHCGGGGGCGGATGQLAFEYAKEHGVSTIWQAPYMSGMSMETGNCTQLSNLMPEVGVEGHVTLPRNDAAALMEAVATVGPVVITVDASDWFRYDGGIFDGCNETNPSVNHAVQLAGYGEENGTAYWLVRNSWGPLWGESGYIRLKRYTTEPEPCGWDLDPQVGTTCEGGPEKTYVCGECGMLWDSSYPTGTYLWRDRRWGNLRGAAGKQPSPPGAR